MLLIRSERYNNRSIQFNNPNPTLSIKPHYESRNLESLLLNPNYPTSELSDVLALPQFLCTQHDSFLDPPPNDTTIPIRHVPMDVDDQLTDETPTPSDPPPYNPPPMTNIFMNHPSFNTKNPHYQIAKCLYLSSNKMLSTKSISIPMNTVNVPIKTPDNPDNFHTITAAADSQSDIEAIGFNKIIEFKNKNMILTDRKGIIVCTGNGKIHVAICTNHR